MPNIIIDKDTLDDLIAAACHWGDELEAYIIPGADSDEDRETYEAELSRIGMSAKAARRAIIEQTS